MFCGTARRAAFRAAVALLLLIVLPTAAHATCQAVARAPAPATGSFAPVSLSADATLSLLRARGLRAAVDDSVALTFLGHSSFLLRSTAGVAAITDYNGYIRAATPPDIVTMNHAHGTHYTDVIEPGVTHVLRGWDTGSGIPRHEIEVRDLKVRNVPTNIRDGFAGTEFAGNSIFIFETAGLCVAHLGHLHHQLEPGHIAQIGLVDVLLAAIDDGWTMAQTGMVQVIETLQPSVVIPMHYDGPWRLASFAALMRERGWTVSEAAGSSIELTRATLPRKTVLALQPSQF
jgi:L-ascorbate metabolism protein UlaG (beta-lactamase superfamily)